ncbi:prkA AAA domain protein, partial [Vibrio harveyi]
TRNCLKTVSFLKHLAHQVRSKLWHNLVFFRDLKSLRTRPSSLRCECTMVKH